MRTPGARIAIDATLRALVADRLARIDSKEDGSRGMDLGGVNDEELKQVPILAEGERKPGQE